MGALPRALGIATFATATLLLVGCGDDDFENNPRPPLPVSLTGVIHEDKVTVSPSKLGAGQVTITISNQTAGPKTITLEGESITQQVGPVEPLDTGKITRTLDPGSYEVRAGSEKAVRKEITPATLDIGKERESSSGDLMLP
ncbi:MAG: hypothetical protein ABW135_15285 [Thermoleophilaceae bacterium]